jgi:glutathione-independent formaldehyde dehydrogenase
VDSIRASACAGRSGSAGRAKPSFIVSHELALDKAPEAYKHFDARDDGWTKAVLKPAA